METVVDVPQSKHSASDSFKEKWLRDREHEARANGFPEEKIQACLRQALDDKLVFLSWHDLRVRVPATSGETREILKGVSGFIEPSQLLAIMGPSGCGKTTLLDTLAGRLPRSAKMEGQVLVNGQATARSFGTAGYVTQNDTLIGTLTVREAVTFSAALRLSSRISRAQRAILVAEVLAEMGLSEQADTPIGTWHIKGISGGQRRRVSVACELVTSPNLIFLDEPTSGLDSAAAYHVMRHIKTLSYGCRTVVAVIHQPSHEVFGLCDQLCLLAGGYPVYFGPAPAAAFHFEVAGLMVPDQVSAPDHYLRCINPDFETGDNAQKILDQVQLLSSTHLASAGFAQVMAISEEVRVAAMPLAPNRADGPSWVKQTTILIHRNFLNMMRNFGIFWMRLAMYVILCIGLGFVYFQLGHEWTDVYSRTALIFFAVAFLTFMSIAAFPAFIEEMEVFIHERLNGYYGVSQFVVANTVAAVPFIFLIAVLSTVCVYFLASLNPSGGSVIYFILDLFVSLMTVESLMMAIAPLVPHYLMGIAAGSGLLGLYMIVCGFFQPTSKLPRPVLRFPLHYIAFHTYAFFGFMKNEFSGTDGWTCPCSVQTNGCSEAVGGASCRYQDDEVLAYWDVSNLNKWVDLAILIGMALGYRVIFFITLKVKERRST